VPIGRAGLLGGPIVILAVVAPCLVYRAVMIAPPPWLIGAVVVAQFTAIVWMCGRTLAVRYRVAIAVVLAISVGATLCLGLPARSVGLASAGLCHAVAYASLLAWFSSSLRPGREPVVTGFARRMRRTMPAKVVRYTRRVTIAWCLFFAVQIGMSATLLAVAPQGTWSSFVNLWNLPLVATMFLAEFGCRLLLFRREPRTGLIATLSGLRQGLPGNSP
jgi:uncharacterized membrane protein